MNKFLLLKNNTQSLYINFIKHNTAHGYLGMEFIAANNSAQVCISKPPKQPHSSGMCIFSGKRSDVCHIKLSQPKKD